jgi:hypothetical protein
VFSLGRERVGRGGPVALQVELHSRPAHPEHSCELALRQAELVERGRKPTPLVRGELAVPTSCEIERLPPPQIGRVADAHRKAEHVARAFFWASGDRAIAT